MFIVLRSWTMSFPLLFPLANILELLLVPLCPYCSDTFRLASGSLAILVLLQGKEKRHGQESQYPNLAVKLHTWANF